VRPDQDDGLPVSTRGTTIKATANGLTAGRGHKRTANDKQA
jgi:hypothetical protein